MCRTVACGIVTASYKKSGSEGSKGQTERNH